MEPPELFSGSTSMAFVLKHWCCMRMPSRLGASSLRRLCNRWLFCLFAFPAFAMAIAPSGKHTQSLQMALGRFLG